MNPIYDQIKQSVSLEQAMRMYGIDPGKNGNTHCPFHGEDKHPSLNVRNNFYFCHTCGAHGDVVGFVSQLFGLRPSAAAIKLDTDFGLHLVGKRQSRQETIRLQRQIAAREKELAEFRDKYRRKTLAYRILRNAYNNFKPNTEDDWINDLYVMACKRLPELEQWFFENPYR